MPRGTVAEATLYPIPEDTALPCKLMAVEAKEVPKKKGGTFWKWIWSFEVYEGPFQGQVVQGNTEAEFNTLTERRGFLYPVKPWYEAILGREIALGEEVDTDLLLGLPCLVTVAHQAPRPKDDGGFWYSMDVDDVMSARRDASGAVEYEEPPF